MTWLAVLRRYEKPLDNGDRKIWERGWAGDVEPAIAASMLAGGYAEHAEPPAPKRPRPVKVYDFPILR